MEKLRPNPTGIYQEQFRRSKLNYNDTVQNRKTIMTLTNVKTPANIVVPYSVGLQQSIC